MNILFSLLKAWRLWRSKKSELANPRNPPAHVIHRSRKIFCLAMCGIAFIKKIQSRHQPLLSTLSHSPISPTHFTMADLPVYDGAIGIDLGMFRCQLMIHVNFTDFGSFFSCQAPPTLALPTMRAPMLKSVRSYLPYPRFDCPQMQKFLGGGLLMIELLQLPTSREASPPLPSSLSPTRSV